MTSAVRQGLLAVAYLAAVLGPFAHEAVLAASGDEPALQGHRIEACCHDPGCTDGTHRHHSHHPPHDPWTCTLCQGSGVAGPVTAALAPPGAALVCIQALPDFRGPVPFPIFDPARPSAPPAI